MDTEIGRLLASMDPAVRANTYVIFVGDNGTNGPSIVPPWDPTKSKSTMFEGGINVPLIITGPTVVPNHESAALVHVADLFATIAELASADASTGLDSTSFAMHLSEPAIPSPAIVYGERFRPNGFGPWSVNEQVARNARFKYWRFYLSGVLTQEHLYDLVLDPFETSDLLDGPLEPIAQHSLNELRAYIDALD
jgi:arylsulfatase A-like enzyme